jgi:hypothetical protein
MNMSEPTTLFFIVQLVLLILVGFVLIWSGVVWLLAWLSGWQRLARHYRCADAPQGQPMRPFLAMLGPVSYRGVLTIQTAPEGLYLSIIVLFRMGHPPLLIPWQAIKRQGIDRGLLIQWLALDLGDPKITTLRLPASIVDEGVLARYMGPPAPRP